MVKAAGWYRKAAEPGNVEAQYCIGKMYENGNGVKIDKMIPLKWYRKAVSKGHATAQKTVDRLLKINDVVLINISFGNTGLTRQMWIFKWFVII